MDELKYVLKCFIFASLIMVFSQVRTGETTIESRVELFLTESDTANFMQEAALGGAKAIGKAIAAAKKFFQEHVGSSSSQEAQGFQ